MGPVPTLTAGTASNLPVTITNTGNAAAIGPITFTSTLPAGVSAPQAFQSGIFNCGVNGQSLFCATNNANVPANGGSTSIVVPITPSTSIIGQTPSFQGTISPASGQTNTSGLTSPLVSPSSPVQAAGGGGTPNLVVSMGPIPTLTVNSPANIQVNISNTGNATATGPITFSTTLPTGIVPQPSFSSGAWNCTTSGQTVACTNTNGGGLSPSTMSSFAISVTPSASSQGQTPMFTGAISAAPGQTNTSGLNAPMVSPSSPVQAAAGGGGSIYPCNPNECTTGVRYGMRLGTDGITYTVYMKSAVAYTGVNALISTAQVTLALPMGTAISPITTIQSGMTWTASTRTNAPSENPSYDFVSVGFAPGNAGANGFSVPANTEIALFSFQRTNACSGGNLYLWHSGEAFKGVSSNTNPGNNMTILGYGQANAWQCNFTCDVLCTTASLSVTQVVTSQTASLNSPYPITINIVNNGSASSIGTISYVTTLPSNMTFTPSGSGGNGWNCSANGQVVTCTSTTTVPNNGGSTNFVINVTPNATGNFSISGAASGGGALGNANAPAISGNIVQTPPDLIISIAQPGTMVLQETNNLLVTVSNLSAGAASGSQTAVVTFPNASVVSIGMSIFSGGNGWTCTPSGTSVSCTRNGTISNTQSSLITIPFRPIPSANAAAQPFVFNAVINPVAGEVITNNNTASITTPQGVSSSDLSLVFGTIPAMVVGQTTQIPMTVVNTGQATATGPLTIQFSLPSNMVPTSSNTGGWTLGGNTVNGNGTTTYFYMNANGLATGNSSNFSVGVTPLNGQTGQVNFTGTIQNIPSEFNTTNNTAFGVGNIGTVDLSLALGALSPSPSVGIVSNLQITITNNGTTSSSSALSLNVTLPAGYSITQAPLGWVIGSQTSNANGTTTVTMQRSGGGLGAGQNSQLTLSLTPGPAAANQSGTISILVTPESTETNTGNNQGSVNVTTTSAQIQPQVVLPSSFNIGQPSNINFIFNNTGTSPYNGPVNFQINLPVGVSIGTLPIGWTIGSQIQGPNNTIIYTLNNPSVSVPVGGNFSLNVPVTPSSTLLGQSFNITINTPTVPGYSTPVNSQTFTSNPVQPAVAPSITINVSNPTTPFAIGQTSMLPIIFNNTGNAPVVAPLNISFSLPAGVTVNQSQLPNGWTIVSNTPGPNGTSVIVLNNPTGSIAANTQLNLNIPLLVSQAAAGTTPSITINFQPQGQSSPSTFTYTSNQQVSSPNVLIIVGQPNPQMQGGQVSGIPVYLYNAGNGTAFGPLSVQLNLPAGLNVSTSQLPSGWTVGSTQAGPNGGTIITLVNQNTGGLASTNNLLFNIPVVPSNSLVGTNPSINFVLQPLQGQTSSSSQLLNITLPVLSGTQPDFTIIGSQPSPNMQVGATSQVNLTINNGGNGAYAGPMTVQFSVPAGYTLSGNQLANGWVLGAGQAGQNGATVYSISNNNVSINAGQNTSLSIGIVAGQNTQGQLITFTYTVMPVASESVISNNSGSTSTNVVVAPLSAPDLAVVLQSQSFSLATGQISNVSFNVNNIGNLASSGTLSLTFAMPANFTTSPTNFSSGFWNCNTNANIVSCTNNNGLAVNGVSSLSIPVQPLSAAGGMSNPSFTITVATAAGEVITNNNTGTINYNGVVQAFIADLAVSFPSQSFSLMAGQTSNMSLQMLNIGNAASSGTLSLNITLPSNFTTNPTSFMTNGWNCNTSGTLINCTNGNSIGVASASTLVIPIMPMLAAAGVVNPVFSATLTQAANESNISNNSANLNYIGVVAAGATTLSIKAMMQGSYNNATGLMNDRLRERGMIPLQQPYNNGLHGLQAYLYNGNQSTTQAVLAVTGDNAIVDWVLVELRNANNPDQIVAATAALIQRDGDVVNPSNGTTGISFQGISSGNYYVALRHRNHLGIMSAGLVNLGAASPMIDLTSMGNIYRKPGLGNFPATNLGNRVGMWAGNANGDDQIIFQGPSSDVDPAFFQVIINAGNFGQAANFLLQGYNRADINLDGKTVFQGPDNEVDLIFFNVVTHPENLNFLANFIIRQHLP